VHGISRRSHAKLSSDVGRDLHHARGIESGCAIAIVDDINPSRPARIAQTSSLELTEERSFHALHEARRDGPLLFRRRVDVEARMRPLSEVVVIDEIRRNDLRDVMARVGPEPHRQESVRGPTVGIDSDLRQGKEWHATAEFLNQA
jgi:hypothetical protein